MINQAVTLRLNPSQLAKLAKLSNKSGKSVQNYLRDIVDNLEDENGSQDTNSDNADVTKCGVVSYQVGDILADEFNLKDYWVTKKGVATYFYFPEEGILAIKRRSSNWAKVWLEVVKVISDDDLSGTDITPDNWLETLQNLTKLEAPEVLALVATLTKLDMPKEVTKLIRKLKLGMTNIQKELTEWCHEWGVNIQDILNGNVNASCLTQ